MSDTHIERFSNHDNVYIRKLCWSQQNLHVWTWKFPSIKFNRGTKSHLTSNQLIKRSYFGPTKIKSRAAPKTYQAEKMAEVFAGARNCHCVSNFCEPCRRRKLAVHENSTVERLRYLVQLNYPRKINRDLDTLYKDTLECMGIIKRFLLDEFN